MSSNVNFEQHYQSYSKAQAKQNAVERKERLNVAFSKYQERKSK